jgi:hypothetical protein
MEEKYKKFLEYNWRDSEEWQHYLRNLSEVPPGNKVEHFKKRFYKLKVDDSFDVKWVPSESSSTTNTNYQQRTQGSFNTQPMATNSIRSPALAIVEVLLWISFLFTIIIQIHTLKIVSFALLIRVLRRIGLPKFNMEYAQLIFLDEHFQILLYALLLMIDRLNFFTLVPLAITAVLNIVEFCKTKPNVFAPFMNIINKIYNKRTELALMRANIEVAIGFMFFVGIFLGVNSLIIPIFYWQYMRFKYIVNNDVKVAFGKLNWHINRFKSKPSVPGAVKFIIEKIQQFASYMGRTEAAPGQAAGGANCVIF